MICKKCGIDEIECWCLRWSEEAQRVIADRAAKASSARAKWLQDTIERLINDGVSKEHIAIEEHPENRTVITVRGERLYEHRFVFKAPPTFENAGKTVRLAPDGRSWEEF